MGLTAKMADEIGHYCWGRPGRGLMWSAEIDEFNWFKNEAKRFISLAGAPFCDKIKIIERIFGDKSDHIAAREKLDNILQIWQVLLSDLLIGKLQDSYLDLASFGKMEYKRGIEIFDIINEARIDLKNNIHPRLLVENILLKIP